MPNLPKYTSFGFEDHYTPKEKEKYNIHSTDEAKTAFSSVSWKVKKTVVNAHYHMGTLLNDMGIDTHGANIYCPFHPDEITGKASAKYHPDTDKIYCFSESRHYTAWDVLKLLQGKDMEKVFREIWDRMSTHEKKDILAKYDDGNSDIADPVWERYTPVTNQFREGNVPFKKHKRALYKVIQSLLNESI